MTQGAEVLPGVWQPPVQKHDGATIQCGHNEFVTGINLVHNCFKNSPEQEVWFMIHINLTGSMMLIVIMVVFFSSLASNAVVLVVQWENVPVQIGF